MNKSRLIRSLGHEFLLYDIDYEKKVLVAHHPTRSEPFLFEFHEKSLATNVFMFGREVFVDDAQAASSSTTDDSSWLNQKGVDEFHIAGPVFACPVRAGGQTEAVLVTWLKDGSASIRRRFETDALKVFRSSCSQARRLANVLANDIYGSEPPQVERFLDVLYSELQNVDHGEVWTRDRLKDISFREGILECLMKSVLHESCGLRRIRVWRSAEFALSAEFESAVRTTPRIPSRGGLAEARKHGFVCVDSLTTSKATKEGNLDRGAYSGCTVFADDVYCRYTAARFSHDPFAQWQHPAMFGQPDRNCEILDKDVNGSWIVAPVVMGKQLLGFLSGDSHEMTAEGPKDKRGSDPREIILQCRIMDVLADLAKHVLAIHKARPQAALAAKHS